MKNLFQKIKESLFDRSKEYLSLSGETEILRNDLELNCLEINNNIEKIKKKKF